MLVPIGEPIQKQKIDNLILPRGRRRHERPLGQRREVKVQKAFFDFLSHCYVRFLFASFPRFSPPQRLSPAVSPARGPAAFSVPHRQSVISGMSSPCSQMYCLCSISLSRRCLLDIAPAMPPKLRQPVDHVASTRWKRSRSFRTAMSNGVVIVPSSL